MVDWKSQIVNHSIRQTLTKIDAVLEQADQSNIAQVNILEFLTRVKFLVDNIRIKLSPQNATYVSKRSLDEVNNSLSGVPGPLGELVRIKSDNALQNVMPVVDNAIRAADMLAPHLNRPENVSAAINDLMSDIDIRRRHLNEIVKESSGERKALLESSNKIAGELLELKKRVDDFVANSQDQFYKSEDKRRDEYEKIISEYRTALEAMMQKAQEDINSAEKLHADSMARRVEENKGYIMMLVEELEARKNEAKKIVGILADTGVTGGFQKVANQEWWAALIWRSAAMVAFAVLVGFSVWSFYVMFGHSNSMNQITNEVSASAITATAFDWSAFSARMFVMMSLVIFGTYAAFQADKHQKEERRNRRLELELTALTPFLENLSSEKKEEVRVKVADKIFGQHDDCESIQQKTGTPVDNIAELKSLVQRVVDKK